MKNLRNDNEQASARPASPMVKATSFILAAALLGSALMGVL